MGEGLTAPCAALTWGDPQAAMAETCSVPEEVVAAFNKLKMSKSKTNNVLIMKINASAPGGRSCALRSPLAQKPWWWRWASGARAEWRASTNEGPDRRGADRFYL